MTPLPELNIVTGAYGYMGKYITRRLLAQGKQVKTLTNHPDRSNEFGDKVQPLPFNFDRYDDLVASLQGAATLYNTYWVRFNYGATRFDQGIENTLTLFRAAKEVPVSLADAMGELIGSIQSGQRKKSLAGYGRD